MLSFSAPAAIMRAFVCLGGLAACLAVPARAQGAKSAAHHTKTLKAGSLIMGRLDRPLCEERFSVGDTISASFGSAARPPARAGGQLNSIYTPRFTAVLRRVAVISDYPPGRNPFVLEVVYARFGKERRNDLHALLYLDPESSDSHVGMPPSRCYSEAVVSGGVTRTLRY
ncbi:MAG TPA: hypothetical protein VF461_10155 [Gemmatimonadaceae bacterium]